jgi:hypothetical protein
MDCVFRVLHAQRDSTSAPNASNSCETVPAIVSDTFRELVGSATIEDRDETLIE